MAQTQAQWFKKIKRWVPEWVFQEEAKAEAIFQAIAKLLAERQTEIADLVSKTFIDEATAEWLDMLGAERSVDRISGELDGDYRPRIRSKHLVSKVDRFSLQDIVNALLIRGVAVIKEDWEGAIFEGSSYYNNAEVFIDEIKDAWTIVVDKQVPEAELFCDSEGFLDLQYFIGAVESDIELFDLIAKAIYDNKAFGTLFRIIERTE